MTKPATILKWVGSKASLAHRITPIIHSALRNGGRYIEPFAGSAAIFFALRSHDWQGDAILADRLEDLIRLYRSLQQGNAEFIDRELQQLELRAQESPRAFYYHLRNQFNRDELSRNQRAAAFIYLNQRCFNGLWRTNNRGKFTTSWGGHRTHLPSLDDLAFTGAALHNTSLQHQSFEATIALAEKNDVIYADPPYLGTFHHYAGRFQLAEHRRLAACLQAALKRGATIVASNKNCETVRALYNWAHLTAIPTTHIVAGRTQQTVEDALLVAHPEIQYETLAR